MWKRVFFKIHNPLVVSENAEKADRLSFDLLVYSVFKKKWRKRHKSENLNPNCNCFAYVIAKHEVCDHNISIWTNHRMTWQWAILSRVLHFHQCFYLMIKFCYPYQIIQKILGVFMFTALEKWIIWEMTSGMQLGYDSLLLLQFCV